MQKIILLRHAEVDISSDKRIFASEFGRWISKYDSSDIKFKFSSKSEIEHLLNDADILVGSSLKRSTESIEIFGKSDFVIDAVFNEAELPYADWRFFRLNPKIWLVVFRVLWFLGYYKNSESFKMFKLRAKRATKSLIDLSSEDKTVVLVGHGIMNSFIRKELLLVKYKEEKKLENNNWGYGVYVLND